MPDETLILDRAAVGRCLAELDVLDVVESTLRLHAAGRTVQSPELALEWRSTHGHACRSLVKLSSADGAWPSGLKLINAAAGNRAAGRERASGLAILYDRDTARPAVIAEAALLGAVRTAAVTAVGVRHLGPRRVEALTLLGAGALARTHIDVLAAEFPSLRSVHVYDRSPDHTEAFVRWLAGAHPTLDVCVALSAREAVAATNLLVTLTTSDDPYVERDWFEAPTFVAHVSLDDLTEAVLLDAEALYVDDEQLAGETTRRILGRLIDAGKVVAADTSTSTARPLTGALGDVLLGQRPAVRPENGLVILNPYGLTVIDIALVARIAERAAARQDGVLVRLV